MNELPLVSIVTPSYNQGAFLEETMRSVLEQDYPKIEYWVIDGGSTDNSVDIIKSHQRAWLAGYLKKIAVRRMGGQQGLCESHR